MKLMIDSRGSLIMFSAEHIGAIMEALASAKLYDQQWDNNKQFKPTGSEESPEVLRIEIVNDNRFSEADPVLKQTMAELERSKQSWLGEYHKRNALETEVAELKKKIEAITNTVSENKEG